MANSKYEYVKDFERDDTLLPGCYIVVRIDGHGFHRFSDLHKFEKPNDRAALQLMNHAAKAVMSFFPDVVLSYGISDEFSFIFRRSYKAYDRRESKLITTVVSIFTGAYIVAWPAFFPSTPLKYPPSFDGRAVLYPSVETLRDYINWRQVDCHINNLYNTTFWALQLLDSKLGSERLTAAEAELRLRGTFAKDKNEILYSEYGINYNNEDEMYKKGSILIYEAPSMDTQPTNSGANEHKKTESKRAERERRKRGVQLIHVDMIQDTFWETYSYILE